MPDQDFQIRIVTTADTSGIRQTSAGLDSLKEKQESIKGVSVLPPPAALTGAADTAEATAAAEQQAAIQSQIQTIAATRLELTQAQIAGDAEQTEILQNELRIRSAILGVMRSESLPQAELVTLSETETAALAANLSARKTSTGLLSGISFAKARNEATTFVRELSSGAPTTRTLGALLGSLGPSLIGGALAGLALKNAIDQVAEAETKVNAELDKSGAKIVELGRKWKEDAKNELTPEEVKGVADAGLSEIDRIGQRIREVSTQELTTFQTVSDVIAKAFKNAFTLGGDPNAIGPFQRIQENLMAG